jgi:ubiquinone/menaquinone biosynthesis C-methylase UbiE
MRVQPVLIAWLVAAALAPGLPAQGPTHGRLFPPDLFPPEDLGILESPDRDDWQQPDRIMDALRIRDGSRVADLGAGGGWFTIRLARRVGPNGRVYAHDIQPEMIESISRRVADQGLRTRVETRLGTENDPKLVGPLDAVLIVDTYPQLTDKIAVLRHIAAALAPNGRLGVVDFKRDGAGGPGPPLDQRLDPAVIRRDALEAGLDFLGEESLRYQYLLIFGRPGARTPRP